MTDKYRKGKKELPRKVSKYAIIQRRTERCQLRISADKPHVINKIHIHKAGKDCRHSGGREPSEEGLERGRSKRAIQSTREVLSAGR